MKNYRFGFRRFNRFFEFSRGCVRPKILFRLRFFFYLLKLLFINFYLLTLGRLRYKLTVDFLLKCRLNSCIALLQSRFCTVINRIKNHLFISETDLGFRRVNIDVHGTGSNLYFKYTGREFADHD